MNKPMATSKLKTSGGFIQDKPVDKLRAKTKRTYAIAQPLWINLLKLYAIRLSCVWLIFEYNIVASRKLFDPFFQLCHMVSDMIRPVEAAGVT